MANKLIDPVGRFTSSPTSPVAAGTVAFGTEGGYTVKEHAQTFIDSLSAEQRRRFKKMIEAGVNVGESIAKTYGLDSKEFIKALKQVI